jgi:antitoxin VapB
MSGNDRCRLLEKFYPARYPWSVSLNIKNAEVVALATEVARLTGETKTEAIRRALDERKARLKAKARSGLRLGLRHVLETEIWPRIPRRALGKEISKADEESILGYGEHGA